MTIPGGILSIPLDPFLRLKAWWENREKRKGLKEQLLNALEIEISKYSENYEELNRIGEEELLPFIDTIKVSLSGNQRNQLISLYLRILNSYVLIIKSFVNLAKGCRRISINPAFMGDLKEASSFLYDFVIRMSDMENPRGVIIIDDRFYTFLKLYEKEFSQSVKRKDVQKSVDELKPYITKIKNVIVPSIRRMNIRRKQAQRIVKSHRTLNRSSKQLEIKVTEIKIREYIPSKFQPITILLDELSDL